MEPVRFGIIGCGVIGNVHAGDAKQSESLDLVAVADLIEDRARGAAEKHGVPRWFLSGDELIECDEVEAVVLAFPTGSRTALARKALSAGKHVLLEKPVAMNAGEVRELIALQGDRTVACCSSRFRTAPSARAISECVAAGTLGSIRLVWERSIWGAGTAPSSPPPPWRQSKAMNGGGILVNWGCYDLDYLLGITGWQLAPETVLAQAWPIAKHLSARVAPGYDADSHFIALVKCQGGAMISLERGEFTSATGEHACRIIGDKASIAMDMHPGDGKVVTLNETDSETGLSSRPLWSGDEAYSPHNSDVLADFARAIRAGGRPMTDLKRALVVQAITDAIYESAETGAEVRLSDLSNL